MLRSFKKIRISWPVGVLLVLYTYILLHIFGGEQGVFGWANNNDKIKTLEQELALVKAKKEYMLKRTENLRSSHIDADLLDEVSRSNLNVSHPKEIVIWLDGTP